MVANLAMESVRLVMTQALMVGCEMHPLQALKYIAPPATAGLLLGCVMQELPRMVQTNAWATVQRNPAMFFLAATLGLLVNVLGVLIIKLSSATTLKVLGAVRGPIVVVLGMLMFGEKVTVVQAIGYSIALPGFVAYNVARTRQTLHSTSNLEGGPLSVHLLHSSIAPISK